MTEHDRSYLHEAGIRAAQEATKSLADARDSEELNRMLHDFGGGERPDVSNVVVQPLSEMVGRKKNTAPEKRELARKFEEISFGGESSSDAILDDGLIDGFERRREMDPNDSAVIYSAK